jgi:hypothetical protein
LWRFQLQLQQSEERSSLFHLESSLFPRALPQFQLETPRYLLSHDRDGLEKPLNLRFATVDGLGATIFELELTTFVLERRPFLFEGTPDEFDPTTFRLQWRTVLWEQTPSLPAVAPCEEEKPRFVRIHSPDLPGHRGTRAAKGKGRAAHRETLAVEGRKRGAAYQDRHP